MGVATDHVFSSVLNEPHRSPEPLSQKAGEHRVLQAAFDTVAATDIDIVMHAHRVGR